MGAGPAGKAAPWKVAFFDFLEWFYEPVGGASESFPVCVTGNHPVWQEPVSDGLHPGKQKDLAICPMCDEFEYRTYDRSGGVVTEVDHLFPRSLYPHLAAHPYNLVPICQTCNGTTIKGDEDPLNPSRGAAKTSLWEIRLPYIKPGWRDTGFVKFQSAPDLTLQIWDCKAGGTDPSPPLVTQRSVPGAGRAPE